jgi:uncharacterized protein (DUF433 family)
MAELLVPRIRVPHPHVRVDAAVLGGSPHVNGSRVPVRRLWAWHRGGASVETLVKRYPNLGPARILDALAFAYDNQDLIEADIEREQILFEQQGGPSVGARPLAQMALPFDGSAPALPLPALAGTPATSGAPSTKAPRAASGSRRR